jgi:ribosomal protein L11 methyltransferase
MNPIQDPKTKAWPEVVLTPPMDTLDAFSAFLFDLGAASLIEEDTPSGQTRIRAGFPPHLDLDDMKRRLDSFLNELVEIFGLDAPPEAQWGVVPQGDWAEKWKEGLEPVAIGSRLVIKPSWRTFEAREGQKVLELDPGLAFGTGQHATTRMCLELLEAQSHKGAKGLRVLDVGTGSGILAMAALLLGFGPVTAIDNDPDVLPVVRENMERNGLEGIPHLAVAEPGSMTGMYDVILANLTAGVLLAVAQDLVRLAAPGGILILSGLLDTQVDDVVRAYQALGCREEERRYQDEWSAPRLVKAS